MSDLEPGADSVENDEEAIYVITRTGRKEPLDTNQITKRLKMLIDRKPKIPRVNPSALMLEVCNGLKSLITTYEIDEYAANAAASLSISNPHYLTVAARIAIDNHQKNTMRSFTDKMRKAYLNVEDGKVCPLVDSDFIKYVEEHQDFIEATIDYNRDFRFEFFGFRTFQKSYSIKIGEVPIERPQDMYMRTAIALNMNTEFDINVELANIKTSYDLMSNQLYTHASPTYYNAGGIHRQYASCFLLGTEDSLEGIEKTGTDMSRISKWAGGIGVHINNWRGTGAKIRGTNGKSSGIVPFLRTYDTRMLAFNQGGRRPGSAAIYLMPHHPDTVKFIQLRGNHGVEKERARDLFYALWVPNIFMERVKANAIWSLFDPDKCGDLSELWGDKYRARYLELESKKMYSSQIKAQDLWEIIKESERDTGMPYICYSDHVNEANMHSHIGTIKSSNLCVTGDTIILTDKGYFPIKALAEAEKPVHNVWNGTKFSAATFAKTGETSHLKQISFSDGTSLKCTPQHRFSLRDSVKDRNIEAAAEVLQVGDEIAPCSFPVVDGDVSRPYSYTSGYAYALGNTLDNTLGNTLGNTLSNQLKVVCVNLYGDKKNLAKYLQYKSSTEFPDEDKLLLVMADDMVFDAPLGDHTLDTKLKWLSGCLDAIGESSQMEQYNWPISAKSEDHNKLLQMKLLCNLLGINPEILLAEKAGRKLRPNGANGFKYYPTVNIYKLRFTYGEAQKLLELGLDCNVLKWENTLHKRLESKTNVTVTGPDGKKTFAIDLSTKYASQAKILRDSPVVKVTRIDNLYDENDDDYSPGYDTYCFNEPESHMGIFNGVLAMNCSEIMLYSDSKEYAVCVLASISLPAFVIDGYTPDELKLPEAERRVLNHAYPVNPGFDFRKMLDVVHVVVRNLNHIVDKTYHPVIETKRGSDRHRPIGLGVQGLDDAYAKMKYAFDSEEAAKLNKEIFEAIYFAALTASTKLCRKKWKASRDLCKLNGSITVVGHKPDTYETHTVTYTDVDSIPKKLHAFPSIDWNGGSPIGKGKFHWELTGLDPAKLSGMFDWESLREHILEFGVMNSHVVALMPTASTSQLLGNNECFEPYTSNVYKRNTSAGEFIVIKRYLMNDLYNLELWNKNTKEFLLASEGSIQYIDGIPDNLKALYKTVWEIEQSVLVQQAIDRQPFVDQAQSLNLYVRDFNLVKWSKLMFQGWRGKLKTGKYYLHTEPAVMPTKFTIEPSKQAEMQILLAKNTKRSNFLEPLREVCDSCSG